MDILSSNTLRAALSTMKTIASDKTVASLANYLRAQDPERAEKTEKLKATLENTLNAMKASKVDTVAQRKAMAMQKLARVKAAIQALKMSVVNDPRIVARLASRLAKELAAAVKEYMAAGGTTAEAGQTGTTTPTASGSTDAATGEATESQAVANEGAIESNEAVVVSISADPKPAPVPNATPQTPVEENEPDQHSGDIWPQRSHPDRATSAYETTQKRTGNDEEDSSSLINSTKDDLKLLRRMVKQARSYHALLSRDNKDEHAEKVIRDNLDEAEKTIDKAFQSVSAQA